MTFSLQRITKRFLPLALILVIMTASASAIEPRASTYFDSSYFDCVPKGNGKVLVVADVTATEKMQELGMTEIILYEEQSYGFIPVKTYNSTNTSGMSRQKTDFISISVSYNGISGRRYYAMVEFYAKNSSGGETWTRTSDTITA